MDINYTPRQYQLYPVDPPLRRSCAVNQVYKTLPQEWPRKQRLLGAAQQAKHIYGTGVPNCYPYMFREIPIDTMYDSNLGAISYVTGVAPNGEKLGPYAKRHWYRFQAYPFHDMYATEVRRYRDEILPNPDIRNWTEHPVAVP